MLTAYSVHIFCFSGPILGTAIIFILAVVGYWLLMILVWLVAPARFLFELLFRLFSSTPHNDTSIEIQLLPHESVGRKPLNALEYLLQSNASASASNGSPQLYNYLHYADVIRLKMVSKYVRTLVKYSKVVMPEIIRLMTCTPETKTDCWACKDQICKVCILIPHHCH